MKAFKRKMHEDIFTYHRCIKLALKQKGYHYIIFPTLDMAKKSYLYFFNRGDYLLSSYVLESADKELLEINLCNGSVIKFISDPKEVI